MSHRVTRASEEEFERWNDYVARSHQAGPFHRREALELLADHTETTLHPLLAYKGEQVIGIWPVFGRRLGPFDMVLSPPLKTVSNLGPALVDADQLKRRKLDRRNRRFVGGCLEWIERNLGLDFLDVRTTRRYADVRPFKEAGHPVEPMYTYVVDTSMDPDDVLMAFSGGARSKIRNADESAYRIELGGVDEAAAIVERVHEQHGEHHAFSNVTPEFVTRLYDELADGSIRPYVCYDADGERAGGMLRIEHGDTVLGWQGATRGESDLPVNELLHWYVIRDAHDRGLVEYDLNGANVPRVSEFKAKFGPELEPYYHVRSLSPSARAARDARNAFRSLRQVVDPSR
jgi:hypothetical protein